MKKNIWKLPSRKFFKNNKLLTIGIIALCSSLAIAGGTIIFNAGHIQSDITIQDTAVQTYDVLIDGTQCPCIITDTLNMQPDSVQQVQHNIQNNEAYPINADATVISSDAGLTVNLYDGSLNPTTTINIPANSNKWLIVEYVTDNTVIAGDTLTSDIQIDITPS